MATLLEVDSPTILAMSPFFYLDRRLHFLMVPEIFDEVRKSFINVRCDFRTFPNSFVELLRS
jgi:hypothetical protein